MTDACNPRHRNEEFLAFLKQVAKAYPRRQLHIVVDNYATHKHDNVTFIDGWNERCEPFVWTKPADDIVKKATQGHTTSIARH